MTRLIEGVDRSQTTLLPEYGADYVGEESPARAIDAFINMLDLAALASTSSPKRWVAPLITRR